MPLDLSGYGRAEGDSFKFDTIGTTLEGPITHLGQPFDRESKYGKGIQTVLCVGITPTGDDQQLIWPVLKPLSQMGEAIINAADGQLAEGGILKVQHHDTEDTGKGNPMKLYRAKYTAPVGGVDVTEYGDEEPF